MFDLGDDIILDNNNIPWLIWIQILVMFLLTLTILLSYFGYFVLDSSSTSSSSVSKTSSSCNPSAQVADNHDARREITTTTSSNRVRCVGERDGSSMKDVASSSVAARFFHPCRYFDFAKEAFLKCLGLDSESPDEEHKHED
ncbi:hypothetical protein SOVF_107560 [Spinacia oleracea]|uniref:Uncharacterized protein isoform X2 n=1 Tax=Spinacia oleracea TaxID=3562 RepID=A0A9R0IE56_SPIOL|nr:uncharacterized protein LOC110787254 isoform X2 [Spinacia oleracea]KNA14421.1 hypothetical protein SOVF_107560 [Spinacia oleracea]